MLFVTQQAYPLIPTHHAPTSLSKGGLEIKFYQLSYSFSRMSIYINKQNETINIESKLTGANIENMSEKRTIMITRTQYVKQCTTWNYFVFV